MRYGKRERERDKGWEREKCIEKGGERERDRERDKGWERERNV